MTDLITTPFGFESTALEVITGLDLHGKRAIVTGSASGIGVETARALAQAGAEVTLAVRNVQAGEQVAADIRHSTGNKNVQVAKVDLADWETIDAFVKSWEGPLHILINNAGVMALPDLQLSPQGHEMQFATNHLGHFRLSLGLHTALKAAGNARVVSVSSRANLRAAVDFDDIDFSKRPYDPMVAYGQSKTANVLFAVEATRRWKADGIAINAVHPGAIADTNLSRHYPPEVLQKLRTSGAYRYKTIEQGAATSTLVATYPALEDVSGHYFEDCNEAEVVDPAQFPEDGPSAGVAIYAVDPENAKRLWTISEAMLAE